MGAGGAPQGVGFFGDVAKLVVGAAGFAPQRVDDFDFVVVAVVGVAGDAASGVGDLGDVAPLVEVVDGAVASAVFDGLALVGHIGADVDGFALPIGLAHDAPVLVVFGFEDEPAQGVGVVGQQVGLACLGAVAVVRLRAAGIAVAGEVAGAVVLVVVGLARCLDLGDAPLSIAHKLQRPAVYAAVADAAFVEVQGVASFVLDLADAKVLVEDVLGAIALGELELAGVEGVDAAHVKERATHNAQLAVADGFELGAALVAGFGLEGDADVHAAYPAEDGHAFGLGAHFVLFELAAGQAYADGAAACRARAHAAVEAAAHLLEAPVPPELAVGLDLDVLVVDAPAVAKVQRLVALEAVVSARDAQGQALHL